MGTGGVWWYALAQTHVTLDAFPRFHLGLLDCVALEGERRKSSRDAVQAGSRASQRPRVPPPPATWNTADRLGIGDRTVALTQLVHAQPCGHEIYWMLIREVALLEKLTYHKPSAIHRQLSEKVVIPTSTVTRAIGYNEQLL
ncbi:unnamed protein product [Schistocephalus solidus]|uniref:Transposase n=1 Tax=Schistocephalus solidus TaxID=70667 RepID=A0A183SYM6_SCHSO|nr:unnamed protein product [Schistocephalus solidus]